MHYSLFPGEGVGLSIVSYLYMGGLNRSCMMTHSCCDS